MFEQSACARALKLLALLLCSGLACQRGKNDARALVALTPAECMTPDRAVVVLLTGPEGYLAPCGCTSNPLGGIGKLAEFWNEQKRCNKDPVLVTAGSFLFDTGTLSLPSVEQEETKAKLIAEIYKELGVFAQTPGPFDRAHKGGVFLAGLDNPWLPDGEVRRVESAGLRLSFIGVERDRPRELSELALREKANAQAPADAVIALSAQPWEANQKLGKQLHGVDVLVSGGGATLRSPQVVGETLLVEAGAQGQYVGVLELVRGEGTRWPYDDGGGNELSGLRRVLVVAERDVQALDGKADPAVRALRTGRRDELQKRIAELEAHPPPPPPGRHLRFAAVPLTKKMPDAAQIKLRVAGYNALLCEFSKRATESLECPVLPSGTPSYAGSERCAGCHIKAFDQWKTTKHARAVETLEEAGKFCDLGCIGCHTTGFNQAGGFCSPQRVGLYKQVGCEMCHGRGGMHIDGPTAATGLVKRNPDEGVCRTCHTSEHSDQFDYAKYRERILGPGHGKPVK